MLSADLAGGEGAVLHQQGEQLHHQPRRVVPALHSHIQSLFPVDSPKKENLPLSNLDGVALPEGKLDPMRALHRADPLHRGDRGQVERAERQAAGGDTAVLKLSK